MLRPRFIPCLLIYQGGLVKTINFATRKYGGGDEQTAMGNFIAELQGSTPGMNNMMDNQSVPPDTQMPEEDPMIQQEIDDIDSGLA